MQRETLIEVVKDAPPVSVAGLSLMGVPIADWVSILVGVYTVFLIIDKSHAVFQRARQLRNWIKEKVWPRVKQN